MKVSLFKEVFPATKALLRAILCVLLITLCLLLVLVRPAFAEEQERSLSCDESVENCVEIGKWNIAVSIGIGLRSNPLVDSDNIPLVLLPEFSYYSDNFFIENLDIGYTLFDSPVYSFNLLATPSYDGVFFNRWDPGNLLVNLTSNIAAAPIQVMDQTQEDRFTQINPSELSTRKFSYLGGFEYSMNYKNNLLQLSLLADISDTHSGNEVRAAYAYAFSRNLKATVGFTWKDSKMADYYYGVDDREIVDDRGSYDAGSSINPFIRISFDQRLKNKDDWRFSFEYQKLDRQLTNSPIVNDDYVVTFFVGKRFTLE